MWLCSCSRCSSGGGAASLQCAADGNCLVLDCTAAGVQCSAPWSAGPKPLLSLHSCSPGACLPANSSLRSSSCPLVINALTAHRAAVGFLAREAATKDYRLDAVHLAICLHAYGVLEPAAGDAGMWLSGRHTTNNAHAGMFD